MHGIVAKLSDALLMFWQALDEEERRLLALGVCWLAAMVALEAGARSRRRHEQEELAERIASRITEGVSRG